MVVENRRVICQKRLSKGARVVEEDKDKSACSEGKGVQRTCLGATRSSEVRDE